jgi:putative endopeptidase
MQLKRALTLTILLCSLPLLAATPPTPLKSGVDLSAMDPSTQPGDDFFQYANGTWLKDNPIPPAYSRWGAFAEVQERNQAVLHDILEALQKTPDASLDPDSRKLRDDYATAMNEAKLEHDGLTPLAQEFDRIQKIASRDDLLTQCLHMNEIGISPLFDTSVYVDEKHSDRYSLHLSQAHLGLPERGYYVGTAPDSIDTRDKYHDHVAAMFTLLGDSPTTAAANADTILAIETQLAKSSRTPVQLRDDEAQYNPKTEAELEALAPNLNIPLLFKTLNIPDTATVIVGQPEYFTTANALLQSVTLDQWRTYLRWRLIHALASNLSSPFENENFHFYQQVMTGATELLPRWKRELRAVDHHLGEVLGRLYVEKAFPPSAKQRIHELVDNIRTAYRHRLETCDWMSPETRKFAVGKLDAIQLKLGYPDHWRDYSTLDITTDSFAQNSMRSASFEFHFWLAKLGQPVDHTLWDMTTPTVNAYYNPSLNEIVFPAGILQAPFFQPDADDAVNYGAIGAVIGHEMTHGFDDQGSRYDAVGNLHDWWTPEDRARYNARTHAIVEEFNACIPTGDFHINGLLTLGENIADLGGLTITYQAYLDSLHNQPAPTLDGFTGTQRFFLGYAAVWRGSERPASLRQLLRTNAHSPNRFRVMVPLSNLQPFYDAFSLTPTNKMYRPPESRAAVW